MSSFKKVQLEFDKTNAVNSVGDINIDSLIRSGGASNYARQRREDAKKVTRKTFDEKSSTSRDSKTKRKEQNRKSSKSTAQGRKAQTKAIEDVYVAISVGEESLSTVSLHLDTQIRNLEKTQSDIRSFRHAR